MNYSIIEQVVTKYRLQTIKMGAFMSGCFLSYGFGVLHGERRIYNEIDKSLEIIMKGIECIIDENYWKQQISREQKQSSMCDIQKTCAHPH
jgi:hypothetical protein